MEVDAKVSKNTGGSPPSPTDTTFLQEREGRPRSIYDTGRALNTFVPEEEEYWDNDHIYGEGATNADESNGESSVEFATDLLNGGNCFPKGLLTLASRSGTSGRHAGPHHPNCWIAPLCWSISGLGPLVCVACAGLVLFT